ncbi:MAG TPA: hypothetical protein ENI26_04440 [Methylophaga aminisulfidivorans]|uniref:VPLPA-CTERM sorting domain-containing protein n=1 Tax=Methylophaga aminisulfidivorans TaxID=230105 RepID=A0A7C1VNG0_9GAMM|nr:hypothetical protein [Methylophaga aminisulfidivorans]
MKKVMLFVTALLLSVTVNAAPLLLAEYTYGSYVTQEIVSKSGSTVSGKGDVGEISGTWFSSFDLYSDIDTYAIIEWTFSPRNGFETGFAGFSGELNFYNILESSAGTSKTGITSYSIVVPLLAGETYSVEILNATTSPLDYAVSISAIPVPAALFLFAPALLGLLGLRRKNAVAA